MLVAVAALVAGCGRSSDDADEPVGPLAAYLADYRMQQVDLSQERSIEASEAVAACMDAQGFDYAPNPAGAWQSQIVQAPAGVGTLPWAQQHGYGIADGTTVTTTSGGDWTDPNAATFAALSAAEQAAWTAALDGDLNDVTDGCEGKAYPFQATDDPAYQRWEDADLQLRSQADDEPAVVAARTAWVDCMADAGHAGFETPDDARRSAQNAADKAGIGTGIVTQSRRAQVLADEIALATADARCDGSSGYSTTVRATIVRLETAFVAQHRAELDAWLTTWVTPSATP